MFSHHGKYRTLAHNQKAASLLSFVAGLVNVVGFLSVQILTTNITGHFAFFVEDFFKLNFSKSAIYLFFILSFLIGSFLSNFIIEKLLKKNKKYVYTLPVFFEAIVLLFIGIFGQEISRNNPNTIALSLLFAMGMQNSLITTLSNTIVRTTHLTGLITDLGIELSQLFFFKSAIEKQKLNNSIKLRLRIIFFFFLGGTFAGLIFNKLNYRVLLIASSILIIGLLFDRINIKIKKVIKTIIK